LDGVAVRIQAVKLRVVVVPNSKGGCGERQHNKLLHVFLCTSLLPQRISTFRIRIAERPCRRTSASAGRSSLTGTRRLCARALALVQAPALQQRARSAASRRTVKWVAQPPRLENLRLATEKAPRQTAAAEELTPSARAWAPAWAPASAQALSRQPSLQPEQERAPPAEQGAAPQLAEGDRTQKRTSSTRCRGARRRLAGSTSALEAAQVGRVRCRTSVLWAEARLQPSAPQSGALRAWT